MKDRASAKFTVGYRPDAFTSRDYILATLENEPDALEAAAGYSRMYYGEISPITVRHGKRKIHVIPRNAGRS